MKALRMLTVIFSSLLVIAACNNYEQTQDEISQNGPQTQKMNKTTVGEPDEQQTRYGTNPNGEGNPDKQEDVDGTWTIWYTCQNSPDVCFTYGVVDVNDNIDDMVSVKYTDANWYAASYDGTTTDLNGDDEVKISLD